MDFYKCKLPIQRYSGFSHLELYSVHVANDLIAVESFIFHMGKLRLTAGEG